MNACAARWSVICSVRVWVPPWAWRVCPHDGDPAVAFPVLGGVGGHVGECAAALLPVVEHEVGLDNCHCDGLVSAWRRRCGASWSSSLGGRDLDDGGRVGEAEAHPQSGPYGDPVDW